MVIGALSPLGVLIGVGIANQLPERVLQLSFAALALAIALQLLRRGLAAGSAAPRCARGRHRLR